jgi:hypothetical protein
MPVEIPRDRWGKPLIIPADGGKPVPYYRASSFGDVLDDRSNLEKYLRRMAVKGISLRPELQLAVSTTSLDEKWKLNSLVEQGIEAAGGGRKASIGTSLHTLTEMLDRGEELPAYPAEYGADLAAYETATRMFEHVAIERFVVCDELGVAGTPDRVSVATEDLWFQTPLKRGFPRITDLKTGGNGDYLGHYAVQLAIYAHSEYYDPESGERTPIEGVSQDWGVIFHMPSGEGRCDLYAMDLVAGWEGALLAADVRKWRRKKGLSVAAATPQQIAA